MDARSEHSFPVVVLGGSAGALDALQRIVAELPSTFSAAVFVVTHVPGWSVSAIPHVLARSGALFATHAIDGAPIAPGTIVVAPPDHHLLLADGVMRVVKGPTENNSRPSIDVLFRSAAATHGTRVCGVLLSGTLDDGVAGLVAIHRAGGLALVQDPEDAQFAEMPSNALATGAVDGTYAAGEIAQAIERWIREPRPKGNGSLQVKDEREDGMPSMFSCPDCGGTLWELDDEAVLRYRCRTGHAYNPGTMLASQGRAVETALWSALRALGERRSLLLKLARQAGLRGHHHATTHLERQAADLLVQMRPLEETLNGDALTRDEKLS
ncbi:MAG: chemotaxis protein CheB [Candidatus Eremiobacteraeota bacterium]|nr:chemotaxis protein CheB [Candidatus Eremiobacteraeota bacterium]